MYNPALEYPTTFSPTETDGDYLMSRYGQDKFEDAVNLINTQYDDIQNGLYEDWDQIRHGWNPKEEMTCNQEFMLENNGVPKKILEKLTKVTASYFIDWIIFDDTVVRAHQRRITRLHKEALKAKELREKEEKKAEKIRLRDQERIVTTSREKLIKWRLSFGNLWNEIMADDIITLEEVYKIKKWLKGHLVRHDDYKDFLTCVDAVVKDGVVDQIEALKLYNHAIHLIDTIVPDSE